MVGKSGNAQSCAQTHGLAVAHIYIRKYEYLYGGCAKAFRLLSENVAASASILKAVSESIASSIPMHPSPGHHTDTSSHYRSSFELNDKVRFRQKHSEGVFAA